MGRSASKCSREPVTRGIRSLTHDGRGIADTEGKTVFVDGALPGETVEWVRTRRKRNFDEARCEQVLVASENRVDPACPVFGQCGGCVMQHMSNRQQVSA